MALIEKKIGKILCIENYIKTAREVKFFKYVLLDEQHEEFLAVCPPPRVKSNSSDFDIYCEKNVDILIKNKNKNKRINRKVLDLVCTKYEIPVSKKK